MIKNCFQSKYMTRDFVCSLTIKSTQRALTEQLAVHHLKMVLLLMYLKRQVTKAFGQVIFCFLASNCFARRVPRLHNADSYLLGSSSLLLLAYLGSYLSLHAIESMLTAALPRENNLQTLFLLPREALLRFPREQLAFPREQTRLALQIIG